MRTRTRTRLLAAVAAAVVTLAVAPVPAGADDGDVEGPVEHVDRPTAVAQDVALVAAKRGWSLQATADHLQVQMKLSKLLVDLSAHYPETYAGGVLAEQPGGVSLIRFKGTVPPGAAEKAAAAGIPVTVRGGSKYSEMELRRRSVAILEHLRSAGYTDAVTAVMPEGFVELTIGSGAPSPLLPPELRDDVRTTVIAGPATRPEHTRGGARLQDANAFECTSGFTVQSATGVTGVTTAAHCSGLDEYDPPNGDPDYAITFVSEHLGLFGDVQWHTSSHVEPNEFYATATSIRTVTSVESWGGIAVNNSYCVYGRSSNNRACDQVYSSFVNALSGLNLISCLVGMDDDNTIPGDSGGTWSFGTEAAGGHRGDQWIWFKYRNVWSVADLYPLALGVTVLS
jgi:hypothetical protein